MSFSRSHKKVDLNITKMNASKMVEYYWMTQSQFNGVHTDFTSQLIIILYSCVHQHETFRAYRTMIVIGTYYQIIKYF